VEAYVGDITTHDIDSDGLKKKAELEAEGLECLRRDFALVPNFIRIIDQYEVQTLAEARFVRIIDKWMPVLVHFSDKGATVRSYTNPEKLVDDYEVHADRLKKEYPDFAELVTVREELTKLVGKHLF
jgi:5'-deoxynucleotidase YfbR-like HD superfamily hydrolase